MKEQPTYYACAHNGKRVGILAVTKVKGEPIQQEWTGESFSAWPAAVARVETLNRELWSDERVEALDRELLAVAS